MLPNNTRLMRAVWPAWLIVLAATARIGWSLWQGMPSVQELNMRMAGTALLSVALLSLWWLICYIAPLQRRITLFLGFWFVLGSPFLFGRIAGVDGDLVPIWEWRWNRKAVAKVELKSPAVRIESSPTSQSPQDERGSRADFPQFLGPDRTGILKEPHLAPNWDAKPPVEAWRRNIGPAWSGFAIVGNRAFTQEQQGDDECVTAYSLQSGAPIWRHSDKTRYFTTIAGEGPRGTPTIVSNRVVALGGTGRLNCLDAETGRLLWTHDILEDAGGKVPDWGVSGSPLIHQGRVIVSAGGTNNQSLLAYDLLNGTKIWGQGSRPLNYGSPVAMTLAGRDQILAFNSQQITAHDSSNGRVLWEHPWGIGFPHVAVPIHVDDRRVIFSSGYGVGSELLEVQSTTNGNLSANKIWASRKMKAKFSNPVLRNGVVYGLDDGMFAAMNVQDGSQLWKSGRYGHGQGLWIDDLFLLMAEEGELVLLRPTPDGPGELHRHRVFSEKTWNPPAISGEWLLVRNDREAVALKIPVRN